MDPTNWLQTLLYKGENETTGNTFAQDLISNSIGSAPTPEGNAFLQATMPRYIKSPPPHGVINKAPHIDSSMVDGWINDYRERDLLRGPQLPGFV